MKFDRRELPAYQLREAARYVRAPITTLRSWVLGPDAIIETPEEGYLSFYNLVEVHVLNILRMHGIRRPRIQGAMEDLKSWFPDSVHPLIEVDLKVAGKCMYVGDRPLVELDAGGQYAIKQVLQGLRSIERDKHNLPIKLYPTFSTKRSRLKTKIVVDPEVSFGRPVIEGTGIPLAVVVSRKKAGETVKSLATEYGIPKRTIENALKLAEKPAA